MYFAKYVKKLDKLKENGYKTNQNKCRHFLTKMDDKIRPTF